jgi:hypothetical protein
MEEDDLLARPNDEVAEELAECARPESVPAFVQGR